MLVNNILALSCLTPVLGLCYFSCPKHLQEPMLEIILVGIIGYFITVLLIPTIKEMTAKKGLGGKDLNKGEAGKKILMFVFFEFTKTTLLVRNL